MTTQDQNPSDSELSAKDNEKLSYELLLQELNNLLSSPAAVARQGEENSTGAKVVRKVYGRLAKLPKDEQARAAKAIGGSQAFRLHHLRHSTQAHRADFRTRQQEANDSVAKRIKKDFPGNPQFARRRRPSVRVGELSVHVVPADSEGFGNGVDVEQRTNEHQLMMRVNDNAMRVLDKLISSGKVDDWAPTSAQQVIP